jgi:hypothetical protein
MKEYQAVKGINGSPNGNRTRVSAVRGQYPRPLDDGTFMKNLSELSHPVNGVIGF